MKWFYAVGLRAGGAFGLLEILDGLVSSNNAQTIFQQLAGWMLASFGLLTITVAAGLMAIYAAITEQNKPIVSANAIPDDDKPIVRNPLAILKLRRKGLNTRSGNQPPFFVSRECQIPVE